MIYILFCIFLANIGYVAWVDRKYEKVGFNVLFSCSLLLVTYIYPVFIYQIMPDYSLFAYSSYSDKVIVKSTALVNLAYACYSFAYIRNLRKAIKIKANEQDFNKKIPKLVSMNQLKNFFLFEIILFCLFLLIGGRDFFIGTYKHTDVNNISGIFPQVWGMLQTFTLVLLIVNLGYNDKKVYMLISIIIITLLSVGHRTLPLNLLLVVIYFFHNKYSTKTLFLFAFLLFFVLSLIGRFRLSADTNIADVTSTEIGYFNFLEDFIVNSRNLYGLYDYVQSKGITYGVSMMGYFLYVIPFGQSLFISLTGVSSNEIRSEIITGVIEGDSSAGLGTHIVGDVYIAFGFIGVILLFYGLGYFVSWIRSKYYNGEKNAYIIYMTLVSGSIFMCRGAFFYSLKNIVWSIIIIGLWGLKAHKLEKK